MGQIAGTKALEIAAHVTHPVPVVCIGLLLAFAAFCAALKCRSHRIVFRLLITVTVAIVILAPVPLLTLTYIHTRNIYHVSVRVLNPEGQVVNDAEITSLPSGKIMKTDGTWIVELPPQTKPADGKLVVNAVASDSYLSGGTTVMLSDDYFPDVTIRLESSPTVVVRGTVLDPRGRPVQGALVSVEGFSEVATTDAMGSFQVLSHYANGQMLTILAKKEKLFAKQTGPAGSPFEVILSSQ